MVLADRDPKLAADSDRVNEAIVPLVNALVREGVSPLAIIVALIVNARQLHDWATVRRRGTVPHFDIIVAASERSGPR